MKKLEIPSATHENPNHQLPCYLENRQQHSKQSQLGKNTLKMLLYPVCITQNFAALPPAATGSLLKQGQAALFPSLRLQQLMISPSYV
jgi:hypothetical protein